jgi:chromosome segregation ATPase
LIVPSTTEVSATKNSRDEMEDLCRQQQSAILRATGVADDSDLVRKQDLVIMESTSSTYETIATVKSENIELARKNDRLEHNNKQWSTQSRELQEENVKLSHKVKAKDLEIANLGSTIKSLTAERDEACDRNAELVKLTYEKDEQLSRKTTLEKKYVDENETLQNVLQQVKDQLAQSLKAKEEINHQLQDQAQATADAERKLQEVESELKRFVEINEQLKQSEKDADAEAKSTAEQLKQAQTEVTKSNEINKALKKQYEDQAEMTARAAAQKLQEVENELANSEKALNKKSDHLVKAIDDFVAQDMKLQEALTNQKTLETSLKSYQAQSKSFFNKFKEQESKNLGLEERLESQLALIQSLELKFDGEVELKSEVEARLTQSQNQLTSAISERDELLSARDELQVMLEEKSTSLAKAEDKLEKSESETSRLEDVVGTKNLEIIGHIQKYEEATKEHAELMAKALKKAEFASNDKLAAKDQEILSLKDDILRVQVTIQDKIHEASQVQAQLKVSDETVT